MAREAVFGKDVLLFKGDDPDNPQTYVLVGCATNMQVNRTRNTTTTDTKCGPLISESDPSYSVTLDSVIYWGNNPTSNVDHRDMVDIFNNEGRASWKVVKVNPAIGDNVITFVSTPSTLNDTYGATGPATFTTTLNAELGTWEEIAKA